VTFNESKAGETSFETLASRKSIETKPGRFSKGSASGSPKYVNFSRRSSSEQKLSGTATMFSVFAEMEETMAINEDGQPSANGETETIDNHPRGKSLGLQNSGASPMSIPLEIQRPSKMQTSCLRVACKVEPILNTVAVQTWDGLILPMQNTLCS
jgi:hypothetical protein